MMQRITLLVPFLAIACLWADPSVATARIMESWPYEKLFKEADLVVIATATDNKDCEDTSSDNPWKIKFSGTNTTFKVNSMLKGKAAEKIVVLHFKVPKGRKIASGPSLVSFRTKPIEFELKEIKMGLGTPEYLLFLKKRKDGRYEPISGPVDPSLSVREMHHPFSHEISGDQDK